MRQLLYLCSWTVNRCNPACKTLYARLKALCTLPKVINIAIAHKLLRQSFAGATKNMQYSERFI
jgi:hypothetical protein